MFINNGKNLVPFYGCRGAQESELFAFHAWEKEDLEYAKDVQIKNAKEPMFAEDLY